MCNVLHVKDFQQQYLIKNNVLNWDHAIIGYIFLIDCSYICLGIGWH